MPLKLFTLAALRLCETADERRKIKRFGNESWAYRALRMSGHTGTKEELTPRLRHLIAQDVPKYRVDFHRPIPCIGTMLRPAGAPCTKGATLQGSLPNPLTGERAMIGTCRNPRQDAARSTERSGGIECVSTVRSRVA